MIEISAKIESESFLSCVCYPPPIESKRNVNANEFLTHCRVKFTCTVKKNQSDFLCGDYNARCLD